MKALVVTDEAAGTAGMKLVERPEPKAASNDVLVQVVDLDNDSLKTSAASIWFST